MQNFSKLDLAFPDFLQKISLLSEEHIFVEYESRNLGNNYLGY